MRRWNGWGDDAISYPLPQTTAEALTELVGPASPPRDVGFAGVIAHVPPTRLPANPLVSTDAADSMLACVGVLLRHRSWAGEQTA